MAAEMTIDMTKTFSGRAPIQAYLRYEVEASTVLILFGPSGSGKTTILRSVAGLEWPEEGKIQFLSRTWLDTKSGIRVSPQDRQIGYMPQDYALFPTYSVVGNIGYGLGALLASDRKKRVEEMLELFQLCGFDSAKPRELSGGQQPRLDRSCCCWMSPSRRWMPRLGFSFAESSEACSNNSRCHPLL